MNKLPSAVLLLALGLASPDNAGAQKAGLVVVAHGADSQWNAGVHETMKQLNWSHGPVRVAFLMGAEASSSSWDTAVVQLQREGVERIVAVPFMVSSYGSHFRQIQHYAGILPEMPPELAGMAGHNHHSYVKVRVPISVTAALDDSPELGQALGARWKSLSEIDRRRPLMLVAHGPNDSADALHWERDILATSRHLAEAISPHPVRVGLMRDDADAAVRARSVSLFRDSILAMSGRAADSVTVLPVLISTGAVNYRKLPADLAGLPVSYHAVGLTPHQSFARWIERVATGALAQPATRSSR